MKMNLSHFKKISEDEKSATLMHPRGHKIVIAKNQINAKLKKDLGELPVHLAYGSESPVKDPLAPPGGCTD